MQSYTLAGHGLFLRQYKWDSAVFVYILTDKNNRTCKQQLTPIKGFKVKFHHIRSLLLAVRAAGCHHPFETFLRSFALHYISQFGSVQLRIKFGSWKVWFLNLAFIEFKLSRVKNLSLSSVSTMLFTCKILLTASAGAGEIRPFQKTSRHVLIQSFACQDVSA